VRSKRTPRIAPTATRRARSSRSKVGRASSTSGSAARSAEPVRYGPSRKATPTAIVPSAPMIPSSHMLGWKRGTRTRMRERRVTYSVR
jgi:hypothetical protein